MILKEAYDEAKQMLTENRDALDAIAAFLIEKETITGKEFMKILREIKGIPEPEEGSRESRLEEKKETSGDGLKKHEDSGTESVPAEMERSGQAPLQEAETERATPEAGGSPDAAEEAEPEKNDGEPAPAEESGENSGLHHQ